MWMTLNAGQHGMTELKAGQQNCSRCCVVQATSAKGFMKSKHNRKDS